MTKLDEAKRELKAALEADDCLGFATHWEARRAVLAHADYAERWECSPRLVAAVAQYVVARRA